jgi:hypothetical protein
MNTAAIRVGRLLEIRPLMYKSAAEVEAVSRTITGEVARVPSSMPIVAVIDWRYCPVMPSDAAERALAVMTRGNPRVLRSAVLASLDSRIAMLQVVRLVRESRHETRRLFFDEDELTRWLGEVLTDPEKVRLSEFLQEPVPRQPNLLAR